MAKRALFNRIFPLVFAALISCTPLRAAESAGLAGTYRIIGAKGPVTLTLQVVEGGKLNGSLEGGDLQATLKGIPVKDGSVLGTLAGPNGKFLSYFQVARDGDKVQFDIIQADAKGDLDFAKKSRLTFPAGAAKPEAPKPEPAKPAPVLINFGGTFKGDTLTLENKAEGAGYSGTIKMAEQSFKFTAAAKEGTLRGEFESPDGKFPFEATLDGRTLTFVTEGTTYTLTKQGNPLAKPAPNVNPLAKPDPQALDSTFHGSGEVPTPVFLPEKSTDAFSIWNIYKHAVSGLTLRYPPNWKLDEQNGTVLLMPPDAAKNESGPAEVYLVSAGPSHGISSMHEPAAALLLEGQIQLIAPFLHRVGDVQGVMEGATPGLVMSWEGTNPLGTKVRANVMATILKGFSVALLGMGDADKIAARQNVLKEIFSSLAVGAGERDAQLVGGWKFERTGNFGSGTTRHLRLIDDGTCSWQLNAETVAGKAEQGRWSATNGQLFAVWDDGTAGTWNYELRTTENGKHLFLKSNQNPADEWVPEG